MSKIEVVQQQVDAEGWDQQLEGDILAGKLETLADRALEDHAAGRSTKL